jgi:hypothetical protein
MYVYIYIYIYVSRDRVLINFRNNSEWQYLKFAITDRMLVQYYSAHMSHENQAPGVCRVLCLFLNCVYLLVIVTNIALSFGMSVYSDRISLLCYLALK